MPQNTKNAFFKGKVREGVKKPRYFTVRLTISIYPGPAPPPSYGQLFVNIFSILVYDSMCSETDFTQEEVNFYATTGIPNSSSCCCSSHSGWIAGYF